MTVRVGLAGLGFMGGMHFNGFAQVDGAEVVAVCDVESRRLQADWGGADGNIDRGAALDLTGVATFTSLTDLLAGAEVDMVDLCVPTFEHASLSIEALRAGKDVFCEKPMALDSAAAREVCQTVEQTGRLFMTGHTLRFWPEYELIKEMVESGRYGALLWAKFYRSGGAPVWSWDGWMTDAPRSGGAALDLHIHDTDTVQWIFGKPPAVTSRGWVGPDGGVEYICTQYAYEGGPTIFAEGGWLPGAYPFSMGATLVFEKAGVDYHSGKQPTLTVYPRQGEPESPDVPEAAGYVNEMQYFIDCIRSETAPSRITPEASADAVAIIEAEIESVKTGQPVAVA